jgi:predicted PurR-regulated permease PerM
MELYSFTIGILTIVIFAVAICAVLGFLKVLSLAKQITTANRRIDDSTRDIYHEINMIERALSNGIDAERDDRVTQCQELADHAGRYTDSRIDQLESKLTTKSIKLSKKTIICD